MRNADIQGQFIWHDLITTDAAEARNFYSRVVGWTPKASTVDSYTLLMAGRKQAAGIMSLPDDDSSATQPHWLVYIGTPDVDHTVSSAISLGGRVLKEASNIMDVGRYAVLSDPQGAAFAVFAPHPNYEGSLSPSEGEGGFPWHELATTNVPAALKFYSQLFGWTRGPAHDMGETGIYQIFANHEIDVGGIYKSAAFSPCSWLSYVRVSDAAHAASAVKDAGGRILNGPLEASGGSTLLQILDPRGCAFALIETASSKRLLDAKATNAKLKKRKRKKKRVPMRSENYPTPPLLSNLPSAQQSHMRSPPTQSVTKSKVFVVHGRDEAARETVARYLERLGINPIILHEQASRGLTVIEKLERQADVPFAVVLLTPDDEGHLIGSNDALQPRARQNVILELGYFVGRLGRSSVCALYKGHVELPSDWGGVAWVPFDTHGGWKAELARELRGAGFAVDLNAIISER